MSDFSYAELKADKYDFYEQVRFCFIVEFFSSCFQCRNAKTMLRFNKFHHIMGSAVLLKISNNLAYKSLSCANFWYEKIPEVLL